MNSSAPPIAIETTTGALIQRSGGGGGGVSALMYAAQQGNVDTVRKILRVQSSALFNRDRSGKSALHYCCTSDNICAAQAADVLVMAAPDLVDGRDEDGFTPLHLAVIAGNMQLVTFLLANKADVNAVDNEKHSVVHWATVCGETGALRAVLAAGAPVSTPDVHGGYPLHYASQMCGNDDKDTSLGLQVLHSLLTHRDIIVSVKDGDKRQPLLWAASAGSTKAILALIRAGAAVEAADKDGLTALHCAASRGHTDCIDSLLTLCGASPDVIDSNGCTALHYAVTLGHADATALLLAHGADPNRQDRKGRSPAHCGCAKGQFETVKLIGAHGANLWLRNARGDLPLQEAAASGRRELVKWLLEMRPSQVNARNNDGRCPLHMAALNDNSDMCKILLDAGAQINPVLRTSKNVFMTPLDCAMQRGFRSTAKYLQLHGGVPANRLGGAQLAKNSAVSLQIRDDVTFWGDTSSDSERENHVGKDGSKRGFRKKFAYRFERKRASMSGSDLESKVKSGLKVPSSRLDYSNEITINGKTEINIHQSKELAVEKVVGEKEKRPKSAKYSKVSAKSKPKIQISTPRETASKLSPERSSKARLLKDQSTNTSEEVTIIENKKQVDEKLSKMDQQSIISNTSEDIEEQKLLVVEASVHEPPKDVIVEEKGVDEQTEEIVVKESADVEEIKVVDEVVEDKEVLESGRDERVDLVAKKEELKTAVDEKIESVVEKADVAEEKPESVQNVAENEELKNALDEKIDNEQKLVEKEELKDKVNEELENVQDLVQKEESKEDVDEKTESPQNEPDIHKIIEKASNSEEISKETEQIHQKLEEKPLDSKEPTDLKSSLPQNESLDKPEPETYSTFIKKMKPKASDEEEDTSNLSSSSSSTSKKTHKSFRILDDDNKNVEEIRSKSEEKLMKHSSKIPTLSKSPLSKSDRHLDKSDRKVKSSLENRVPSLPNINDPRPDSHLSAPHLTSMFSENDSDVEDLERSSIIRNKRKVKKRAKAKSAASDYESSNLIDSGFEPSPRSQRVPKAKNMSNRGVNMTTVTQTIQSNIRKFHMERKIFQQLLELKRHQIRAGQHNEAILVKRAIDAYHKSCASTVGVGRYVPEDYSFKSFEKFLYQALRKLQINGAEHLKGLPEAPNPLHCTRSTHRCMHATHAYTGIPCAAYLPKMDHHNIPKIGFNDATCKPGTAGFLPNIGGKSKDVTLELSHGIDKQIISLPTDRLDQNKRYYVTFTVKGQETSPPEEVTKEAQLKEGASEGA